MKKIAVGLLLAVPCFTAQAESFLSKDRFSVEGVVGYAEQDMDYFKKGNDLSFGVRTAYAPHKNVALEAGYLNFGEVDETYIDSFGDTINDIVSSQAFTFGVKGMIPLKSGFSLTARLGLAYWDVDAEYIDTAFPGQVFEYDDTGLDFYYGLGAQYAFNEHLYIGLDYTAMEMSADFEGVEIDNKVSNAAFSVGYNF